MTIMNNLTVKYTESKFDNKKTTLKARNTKYHIGITQKKASG